MITINMWWVGFVGAVILTIYGGQVIKKFQSSKVPHTTDAKKNEKFLGKWNFNHLPTTQLAELTLKPLNNGVRHAKSVGIKE